MIDTVKALIRPFIIVWGFLVYGVCILAQIPIPDLLGWLVSVVIIEYFSERATKRLKELKKQ